MVGRLLKKVVVAGDCREMFFHAHGPMNASKE